jgi:hypothetical protein
VVDIPNGQNRSTNQAAVGIGDYIKWVIAAMMQI